ncbi:hypothetical protein Nepgr_033943 [Nepenthes gracilis]|uniref:Uncharacterized protein n=1 Tax=Nepenthes gracilis TaxID=150966 RepID=A0AAD3Y915_NEPGR|nr:hypothetical protein Nepgr_033943 [Nepenthes gracilis]
MFYRNHNLHSVSTLFTSDHKRPAMMYPRISTGDRYRSDSEGATSSNTTHDPAPLQDFIDLRPRRNSWSAKNYMSHSCHPFVAPLANCHPHSNDGRGGLLLAPRITRSEGCRFLAKPVCHHHKVPQWTKAGIIGRNCKANQSPVLPPLGERRSLREGIYAKASLHNPPGGFSAGTPGATEVQDAARVISEDFSSSFALIDHRINLGISIELVFGLAAEIRLLTSLREVCLTDLVINCECGTHVAVASAPVWRANADLELGDPIASSNEFVESASIFDLPSGILISADAWGRWACMLSALDGLVTCPWQWMMWLLHVEFETKAGYSRPEEWKRSDQGNAHGDPQMDGNFLVPSVE